MRNTAVCLILAIVLAIFYGCGGSRQSVSSRAPNSDITTTSEIEAVKSRISGAIPNLNDEEAWNRGLGLMVKVFAIGRENEMVSADIPLFTDFGNETNVSASEELELNLRLIAEIINRAPNLQGISIISFAGPEQETVNRERALAIVSMLISYGVDPRSIRYEATVNQPNPEEENEPSASEINTL